LFAPWQSIHQHSAMPLHVALQVFVFVQSTSPQMESPLHETLQSLSVLQAAEHTFVSSQLTSQLSQVGSSKVPPPTPAAPAPVLSPQAAQNSKRAATRPATRLGQ
jgi:hypothetical protein